jgi:dipeptidyl aminopeptidase/acylaminoacyl peptidase
VHPPRHVRFRSGLFALLLGSAALFGCGGETARTRRPSTPAAASGGPPAAAFFADPLLSHVVLSPDGQRFAAVSARDGVIALIVRPTWGGDTMPLAKLGEPGTSLAALGWAADDVIVVSLETPLPAHGERARRLRLIAVDVEHAKTRDLGEKWPSDQLALGREQVIDWLPDDPKHVLIHYQEQGKSGPSAARVDVRTGNVESVAPAEKAVQRWYADPQGEVRVGEGSRDGSWLVVGRRKPDGDFEDLTHFDRLSGDGFTFAGYSSEPRTLYVYAPTAGDRIGLFSYDLNERALGPPVYADPVFDVGALVRSPRTGKLLGVEVPGDRPAIHFFDDAAAREQAAIDRAFPGTTNRIVSLDRAERTAIVAVSGDTKPPEYYAYDREQKKMDFLAAAHPSLDAKSLAPMQVVRYPARDGLEIQAYLTLPRGGETHLPVIVVVHDGPNARDVWGWDATAQFLASRGFAVFQPNYRGSTGFGRAHERKGVGQWGRAMQNDIADGVEWLVAQGTADRDRIGIYGVGYGGYAALEALEQTPQLYRAGASFGAITDLADWLGDRESDAFSARAKASIGGAAKDDAQLKATSPARHAGQVRVPVLIAHGSADPIVDAKQSHTMAKELEDAKVEVETWFYRDELHEFIAERDRIDFHERLAAFFARHLARRGAPADPGAPPAAP